MEGTFVEELERVIANGNHTGKTVEVKGRTYLFEGNKAIEITERRYTPNTLSFTDLTSFCKIINEEADKLKQEKLFVKIEGYKTVRLISTLDDKMNRIEPYEVHGETPSFSFGSWLNYEDFVIGLRAKFVPNEDRDEVIKMIASIVNCDSQEMQDNGITQTVKTQRGTQLAQRETKSILKLKPYRTFVECEQPES